MTRERLMAEISASEFVEWMILEQGEPWGQRRMDLYFGILCATLVNIHRDPSRAPFQPSDFIKYLPAIAEIAEEDQERVRALRISRVMAGVKQQWNERLRRRGESIG